MVPKGKVGTATFGFKARPIFSVFLKSLIEMPHMIGHVDKKGLKHHEMGPIDRKGTIEILHTCV